nr:hypothetical protein CFP56_72991 [Quercus suber]
MVTAGCDLTPRRGANTRMTTHKFDSIYTTSLARHARDCQHKKCSKQHFYPESRRRQSARSRSAELSRRDGEYSHWICTVTSRQHERIVNRNKSSSSLGTLMSTLFSFAKEAVEVDMGPST